MNNYKVNIQWLLVLLNEAYFLNFLYLNFLKGKSNKLKFRLKFELGEYILFQTAITIIKLLEEDLLNLTISEVFKLLKRLPKKYTDLEFFEKFKNYNCISEEFIRWNKHYLLKEQIKLIKE